MLKHVFHAHTNAVSSSVRKDLSVKTTSHRNETIKLFCKSVIMVCLELTSSVKNCTICKSIHCLTKLNNVSVSMRRQLLLEGGSGQAIVLLLLHQYYLDFIADLVLFFGVIIYQMVFVTLSKFTYNFGTFVQNVMLLLLIFR